MARAGVTLRHATWTGFVARATNPDHVGLPVGPGVAEVAAVLGCAEDGAKVHLHRGRAALARLLDLSEEDT